jgi:hypothetical protein
MEDMPKIVGLRDLLHLRSRISDRHEVAACFVRANNLLSFLKEKLFENIWFQRTARFTGNNEQSFRDINLVFEGLHLCWIRRIEHMQLRPAADFAEG